MSAASTIGNLQQALNCAGKCDCCNKLQQQINALDARIKFLEGRRNDGWGLDILGRIAAVERGLGLLERGLNQLYQVVVNLGSRPGVPGPPGPKGERGERGLKGDRGERGLKGDRGERGLKGDRGERGLKGDRGERGLRGLRGERGFPGERGLKGDRGERGYQGLPGLRGERGYDGMRGGRGERGYQGDRGRPGFDGRNGRDGRDGRSASDDPVIRDRLNAIENYINQLDAVGIRLNQYVAKTNSSFGNLISIIRGFLR